MKPRFEEHEGQLFRMLEEPVPLQLDSPMPCLVRYIQDCSPMGRYMKRKYAMVINTVAIVSRIGTDGRAYSSDKIFAEEVEVLEIIGYPVDEGSHWWALNNALAGRIVTMEECAIYKIQDGKLWECFPNDSNEWRVVAEDGIRYWLEFIHDETGWQLYEPETKPLLADAKVGDLCKTDLDEWIQIDDTSEPPSPILYHYDRPFKGNIIHTEPLAPEGSAEWALQMWKLGNDIRNETGVVLMADYESEEIRVKHLVDVFPSGWQLYKEPELKYKVGDWVECVAKQGQTKLVDYLGGIGCYKTNYGVVISPCEILRKLSHSEVVVPITISGTVRPAYNEDGTIDDEQFQLLPNGSWDGTEMFISFDALDSHTRKLIESLLKAQEEK